ncbi:ciliated left-right organizer metallopeptidase-like [Glandiceps talaboti]
MKIGLRWLIMLICTTASQCPKIMQKSPGCGFDRIQPATVPTTNVQYLKTFDRQKRSTVEELYRPIRITAVFSNLLEELDDVQQARLQTVVKKAVTIIEGFLSVIPVSGPLLLARSDEACKGIHTSGINKDKCASIKTSYIGEYCLDDFKIPDDHLEGLFTWNETYPKPFTVYPTGEGLANTDFVLYVRAKHTLTCNPGDIIAYAKYCNVDQNDRPLAGYSNFCPQHLDGDTNDDDTFILTAAHEIFHTLGFSAFLYDKFKECTYQDDVGLNCETRNHQVVSDSHGQSRLATPAVVNKTQQHFGCSEDDFGGPLENYGNSNPSSHWEARLMLGSLMTATIGIPHLTVVDPITLAVFEDTGWYKVNYTNAQDLIWGENEGCNFGLASSCDSNTNFFCTDTSNLGCHHLLKDKANCTTNDYLEGCGVYKAEETQSCLDPSNGASGNLSVYGEYFDWDSRCFITHSKSSSFPFHSSTGSARCFRTRCNDSETLEIQVGDEPWQLCPSDSSISIPGYYSQIDCPNNSRICREEIDLLVFPPPTTAQPEESTVLTSDNDITIDMVMTGDYDTIVSPNKEEYKNNFSQQLADAMSISSSRIEILSVRSGSIIVTLQILSSGQSQEPTTSQVLSMLEDAVLNQVLVIMYNGVNYTVIGVSVVEEGPTTTTKESSGLNSQMIGVIVGVLCICIILLLMLIIALCKTKKKRRVVAPMYMQKRKASTPAPESFTA